MPTRPIDVFACFFLALCVVGQLWSAEQTPGPFYVTDADADIIKASKYGHSSNCDCEADSNRRAGYPRSIAWYAKCSIEAKYVGDYVGDYVGGNSAWPGGGRADEDGTWGVDYVGGLIKRRVWLNWSHGRRYQGGTGAYKTDGPNILKGRHGLHD